MQCLHPWSPGFGVAEYLRCGTCKGCLMSRQFDWMARMQLECMTNATWPVYFTLTYRDQDLPPSEEECWEQTQKLPRRIRRRGFKIRYVINTETGPRTNRLHHHGVAWISPQLPTVEVRRLILDCWRNGYIDKRSGYVRRESALRYVSKYVTKSKRMTFSLKPVIGGTAVERWCNAMTAIHEARPFESMAMVPSFINGNVLGKPARVKVPEAAFLRLCRKLGVPYAPVNSEVEFQRKRFGVPTGPLDVEQLEASIGLRFTYGPEHDQETRVITPVVRPSAE